MTHKMLFAVVPALSVALVAGADEPSTQPTTMPTTAPVAVAPTTAPVSAVDALLNDVDAAYAKLQSATFDGTITGHFDVAGDVKDQHAAFTSSYSSPNKFRHETTDDVLIGSDGADVYTYLKSRDAYQSVPTPNSRVATSEWPTAMTTLLSDQNPAVLLSLGKSASAELKQISKKITVSTPANIDGVPCPTLRFESAADEPAVTMSFDPQNHLLRQARFDYAAVMTKAGAADVKAATVTVTYGKIEIDPTFEPARYAWTPPAGTALVTSVTEAVDAGGDSAGSVLVGLPAPDFTLPGLDDKPVTLSSLKGSVVVLDFFATWCGPCKQSLPLLSKMYNQRSAAGLKFFALDQSETKEAVQALLKEKKWDFPVLLDADAAVGGLYKVQGIPQTVVVGKDGKVKKVFVGSGQDKQITALVDAEMKK